jgi:hypothetical protein
MRRAKTFLVLGALVAGAAYLVIEYGNMTLIELNIRITEEGYASDRLRWQLILAALDTGLSNPILGVSPQRLPVELGRYVGISGRGIDAHNVLGLIFGGTGFLGFFSFLAFGYAMFFRNKLAQISARANEAHFLLRCMIVVWFTRAMFSGEIIFSPSFSLALGMAIGLCVATGVWQRPQRIVSPRMAFGRQASRVRAA